MSAELKTKYTKVYVSTDEADPKQNYFGYISVNFDISKEVGNFFADTYDVVILNRIREFFKPKPNYMVERQIRIEDCSILVDLTRTADKVYAADIIKIVKSVEGAFDSKVST